MDYHVAKEEVDAYHRDGAVPLRGVVDGDWLELLEAGIELPRICLDPGIGFGKTHEHNLQLIRQCRQFHQLGCPLLVGHSRKGFIGRVLGDKELDRTAGTVGIALWLAQQGIQVIRVHDVAAVQQALLLFSASGGLA